MLLTAVIVLVHKVSGGRMSFLVSGAPWTHRFWSALFYLMVAGVLLAFGGAWAVRPWIPPAPLHVARGTLAWDVAALEPVEPRSVISVSELKSRGGVVCFTAIYAPPGLREPISHVWRKDGLVVATARLSPIRGGRAQGFRTYSRRADLGPNPVGRWVVDVLTADGQLIGRVRFEVTA